MGCTAADVVAALRAAATVVQEHRDELVRLDQAIGDAGLADAICDRLIHCAHRLELDGPSMRDPRSCAKKVKS